MKAQRLAQLAPFVLALLCAPAGAQQLYKWVAPDGTVSYSDKPPPSTAAKVEKKSYAGGSSTSYDDLPFELANAARNNPVTMYTSPGCGNCELGRKMLNERGIPYSEKTVTSNDESNQFTKQMGTSILPVLMVGHRKLINFIPDEWTGALTSAGYPTSNHMPRTHKNPAPEPLIAQAPPKSEAPPPASEPAPAPQQPADDGKPGFHF